MLGDWKRLSFRANDAFIDRSRQFCERHVAQKFNDEYICYPMEVYYKEENGKNYKVLLLGKHFKKYEFKCFSSVTVVPEGKRPQPELKEDTFKAIDGTDCTLDAEKQVKLKAAVGKDFTPVKFFENALDGGNVYLLKVDERYFGVFEAGNEFNVDCQFH